ncbi:hypothetical protein [Luedemannella helvata]|uniref:Uncharacterized protein n=1 Tax=Luedemannella helvata TaxID=349315 RepID=A0ABP4W0P7_9ACTN
MELSVGFVRTRAKRVTIVSVLGTMLVVVGCCAGGLLAMMLSALISPSVDGNSPARLAAGGVLVAVLLGTMPALQIAWIVRLAAWLDNTRLTVRGLGTRAVELRTAHSVRLDTVPERGAPGLLSPMLTVAGPEGTVSVRLRSRDGALIPPHEMTALADALSTAASPGAAEAAAWLRSMAADPRTKLM